MLEVTMAGIYDPKNYWVIIITIPIEVFQRNPFKQCQCNVRPADRLKRQIKIQNSYSFAHQTDA